MAGVNSGIPTFYVQQFSSNIQLKLQQKGSRLRSAVMSGMHIGSQASPVDQFGAISANKVVGRYQPIVAVDAPTDRRWVFPQDYDLPQLLDTFDKLRLLIDPMSSYVENAVYALGRAMDQEILNGLLGSNKTGVSGATNTTLPSSQIVSVQQGASSSTNLTVAKLRAGMKILLANEVDLDQDQIFMAINAAAHDSLLSEVQVISTEFNDKPVMVEGKIQRFLGVNFIHTELVTTGTDDQSGTSTALPMWAKSGAYMGIWNDIESKISERNDLQSIPFQAYVKGTFGGTRLEEKKVVQIWSH
ncbi:MAG: phage capsid protein [Herbaspirillum sp.]